jgi:hypothetical protein
MVGEVVIMFGEVVILVGDVVILIEYVVIFLEEVGMLVDVVSVVISHNLHLQYLAKNQSTQRCQSLNTPGSDHPPVLEPHMVLNLPLDEYIDNTHI